MSPGVRLSLLFPECINNGDVSATPLRQPPLFLAANGIHGVAKIYYGPENHFPISHPDVVRLALQGVVIIKIDWTQIF